MKLLRHQSSNTAPVPFVLPRHDGGEWTFQLSPLPLGFQRRLRSRGITPPTPHATVARDSTGKPMRDAAGLAVMRLDEQAPAYQTALELYHQRVAILAIAEALRSDPEVQFEAIPPAEENCQPSEWPRYADQLYDEFAAAGFTDGDLIRLCEEVCRLSNLVDDHLSHARRNFSPVPEHSTA